MNSCGFQSVEDADQYKDIERGQLKMLENCTTKEERQGGVGELIDRWLLERQELIVREAEEFNDGGEELAAQLYPKITLTTEIALDFNDKYDTDEHCVEAMNELTDNLSKLGEVLVSRFDLEDQLIEVLHNSHADLVA